MKKDYQYECMWDSEDVQAFPPQHQDVQPGLEVLHPNGGTIVGA